jgi:hypothetical protein
VDTAFVGRLGLLQLAALGPNAALFNVLFFLGFTALAVVATDQMASANSKGDKEGVGRGFFTALVATLVFGTSAMCLLLAAPEQVRGQPGINCVWPGPCDAAGRCQGVSCGCKVVVARTRCAGRSRQCCST